jgi:hypothetical protein
MIGMGVQMAYSEDNLQRFVWRLRLLNKSLRKIAEEDFKGQVNHATIQRILKGMFPADQITREKLGLQQIGSIVVVNGIVPEGTQAIGANQCVNCDRWFIPNHPRRRKCFTCSAPRVARNPLSR